jgi:hypothetical protein
MEDPDLRVVIHKNSSFSIFAAVAGGRFRQKARPANEKGRWAAYSHFLSLYILF